MPSDRDDLRKDAVRAMASFSFWGQLIVAAIVLTGVVNIALTSHHPRPADTLRATGRQTRHRRD
jgi:putative copper export protein